MFAVGLVYLSLERYIIDGDETSENETASRAGLDIPTQFVYGSQMGLVLLAIIVTWHSVITLQARQGLGNGNIYVGWFTLGKKQTFFFFMECLTNGQQWHLWYYLWHTVGKPRGTTSTGSQQHFCNLHRPSSSSLSRTKACSTSPSACASSAGCD